MKNENQSYFKNANPFLKYAMAVAISGHHNIAVCGKSDATLALRHLECLLPPLSESEKKSVEQIYSLVNLIKKGDEIKRPFRQPHQTASLEGMVGGGVNLRPGEITLAHNGVLFLDEAQEFKTSVLQLLRVPLEAKTISLAKAGRSVTFPADFLLAMKVNPCPCGNFGSKTNACLCSARAIEMYWKKFSAPLLDKITICVDMNNLPDFPNYSLEELKQKIEKAIQTQKSRNQKRLNNDLSTEECAEWWQIKTEKAQERLSVEAKNKDLSQRQCLAILKLSRTIADMENHDLIYLDDMETAIKLNQGFDNIKNLVWGIGK